VDITLNLDVNDIDRMEAFWSAALGYRRRGEFGQYRSFVPESGSGPKLILQQVPEPKAVKNRLHLDLDHEDGFDVAAEVARLEQLGATRVSGWMHEMGDESGWIVMADPEGNEFCVCAGC
jgi:predicted enzyme related to lactoylglutathione lyase